MSDIYQEAIDAIVSSDRSAAEDVATRAPAQGTKLGDIVRKEFVKGVQDLLLAG